MKIPPPIQALVSIVLMYLVSRTQVGIFPSYPVVAIFFWGAGLIIGAIGVLQFKRRGTTIDPMKLESASTLITTGIYTYTRNPMYLGLVIILFGCSVWLGSILSLLVIPFFIVSMTYLQIKQEEAALTKLFGTTYLSYQEKVRRWL